MSLDPVGSNASVRTALMCQNKWQLLQLVENAREPLKLKSTTISLLRAMLSFVHGNDISTRSDAEYICFASNAALAERTHVSIQTIERHIGRLIHAGLIKRRCSGNGKRWARRDGQGAIVLVSGLSLRPLLERMEELQNIAATHQKAIEAIRVLKDRCRLALAELQEDAKAGLQELIQTARNILRRKSNENELQKLLSDISHALGKTLCMNSPQPSKMRGKSIADKGQKETDLNQTVKEENSSLENVSSQQIEKSYPKLCVQLRFAKTHSECQRIMDQIAQCLHLHTLWPQLKQLGHMHSFVILGYVYERADTLQNPAGYVRKLMKDAESGALKWGSLLLPLKQP